MVDYTITKTVFGERPDFVRPTMFLEELTVDGFRAMMESFYYVLIESDIANFFPQEESALRKVIDHNTKYFVEIAGGPKDYSKLMGHVDQVKMHEPFSIPEKARVEWLGCFQEVIEKLDVRDEAKQQFWNYLETHSKHFVNIDTKVHHPEEMTRHKLNPSK
ncbi:MAG: globin [Campylobacterota bacterium]|nr:globin [Campylobacterota bacterium]